jgi:hypothetical protein
VCEFTVAMLAPVLTVLILLAYTASLWWLLRSEKTTTMLALVALCGLSFALRLVYTTEFPPGFIEDEPWDLNCAVEVLKAGRLFTQSSFHLPVLLNALFQAQLVPLLGPTRWTIRGYSLVTSVLATPAAFAAARALRLRTAPSLAAAAFVVMLPWSIFYGRVMYGGELVFHQLLLVAALALLIGAEGGWLEVGIGGFGLCLLLYDYFAGRAMLGLPLVAAALASGRRRLLCVAVLAIAFLGWSPYLAGRPPDAFGGIMAQYDIGFATQPLATLRSNTLTVLRAFVTPTARDGFFTICSAAMHPLLILALAGIGTLAAGRRGLFLLGGFVGGLAPAIVSGQASTHRMMLAFPFIALAAACALDGLPWRRVRLGAAVAAALIVGVQSVRLFFSPAFWPWGSRAAFAPDRSALVEAIPLPPHPRLVLARQVGYWWGARELIDSNYEVLSVDNWFPPDHRAQMYAFTGEYAALRPFYDGLFGAQRVSVFQSAFLVSFEAGEWSWLQQHGWKYETHCGDAIRVGQVPTLFHLHWTFRDLTQCAEPVRHVWSGRWTGPPALLRLRYSGAATVDTAAGRVLDVHGWEHADDFHVAAGSPITVRVTADPFVYAALFEVTPAGELVPAWERVDPEPPLASEAPTVAR